MGYTFGIDLRWLWFFFHAFVGVCVGQSVTTGLHLQPDSADASMFTCGVDQVYDASGNAYSGVVLGGLCWFTENLRAEHFSNGSPIPGSVDQAEWVSASGPLWSPSGLQSAEGREGDGEVVGGRLYNAFAVHDAQSICPTGWRVPTDEDWDQLVGVIYGVEARVGSMDLDHTDCARWYIHSTAGQRLKGASDWRKSPPGTNETGFNAKETGFRRGTYQDGAVYDRAEAAWWSSTITDGYCVSHRSLARYFFAGSDTHWRRGYAVRCVRDTAD